MNRKKAPPSCALCQEKFRMLPTVIGAGGGLMPNSAIDIIRTLFPCAQPWLGLTAPYRRADVDNRQLTSPIANVFDDPSVKSRNLILLSR